MGVEGRREMIGKVYIEGKITLDTGLHIGGAQESMQIGGVDSPFIKDSAKNLPYIPGSSLKGKLRATLEKFGKRNINGKNEAVEFTRNIGGRKNTVFIHCCNHIVSAIDCDVCRVFGSSGEDSSMPKGQKGENFPALLMVRDCPLDLESLESEDPLTETKMETGIDRVTMSANPRQVERVLPGNAFRFEMAYSVENISLDQKKTLVFSGQRLRRDLENILTCMAIVEDEGIGGYTSRGYGKISFSFTAFLGRTLGFFMGKKECVKGRELREGFPIDEARKEIDGLVKFFAEESRNAPSH